MPVAKLIELVGASANGPLRFRWRPPLVPLAAAFILLIAAYAVGLSATFAFDSADCPAGYSPHAPPRGVIGDRYECRRADATAEGQDVLPGGALRREFAVYFSRLGLRAFRVDLNSGSIGGVGTSTR